MGLTPAYMWFGLHPAGDRAAYLAYWARTARQNQSAARTISDPDLGKFTPDGPAWLYPVIRKEPRDAAWASGAEQALTKRYATVRFFGAKPRLLRVTCRKSLCEVAAAISEPMPNSSYGEEEASIVKDMRKQGLRQMGALVSNEGVYLAYYSNE